MKISPAQSDFLNWSRWVAAWLVVAEHARSLIFVDYGELQSPRLLAKVFYFLTGFGHEAVMVFFVISGYLVGGKVWSLFRKGGFEWRRYLADRLSRLYAVLLVALMLGTVLDWTGYLFFNKYGLYNQAYEGAIAVLGTSPIERMGGWDFLVNAFFLQTIVGPPFGSNGPLWSLAYEWWYYILFPGILLIVFRKSVAGVMVGVGLSLLLIFVLPSDIVWLFGIWILGVVASMWTKRVPPWGLAMCLLISILLMARGEVLKVPYASQYLLGAAYALSIVSLARCEWRMPWFRSAAYLADFSYSVYLIHFPVLMCLLAVGFEFFGFGIRMTFGFAVFVWYGGVFGSAIIVAWIVSLFTERKTAILRRILYSCLHVR